MRYLITGLLLISGCSMQADPPPNYSQAFDLNDGDLDGVINQRDDCVSNSGVLVDNQGCGTALTRASIEPGIILFDNDQDQIRSDQQATIRQAVERISGDPAMTVTLVGHTSATASEAYNLALSRRRVDNVRQALMDNGVDGDRIATDYRGEDELKYQGDTELVHSHNRRVEIRYLSQVSQPVMRWHINSVDLP